MNRCSFLLVFCSLFGGACKDDGPTFISFDALCGRHAEDVCDARQNCCEMPEQIQRCRDLERSSCIAQRDDFAENGSLTFDGRHASRVLREQEDAVLDCEAPFPVGRYFRGTLAAGKECERDAQCQSHFCDEQGACADLDAPLCAAVE